MRIRFIAGLVSVLLILWGINASAQIYINEILASNSSYVIEESNPDWIELYNNSNESIDLTGYSLTDNDHEPQKWMFPDNTSIEAGGFLLIAADGTDVNLHTNFRLSAGGEQVALYSNADNLVDRIVFFAQTEDISYGRAADAAEELVFFSQPTPGASNSSWGNIQADKPSFSILGGMYCEDELIIELSSSASTATIYYTIDGSTPTQDNSIEYSSSIIIDSTTVIRAISVVSGQENSAVATHTYFIENRDFNLPVISLSTDPDNFFGDRNGIYVEGTNGVAGLCTDYPVNWNQNWMRPVSFELYDADGDFGVQLDAETKIFGGCSRINAQKSLSITARSEYGQNRIRYKFFDDKDVDEFKAIVLRNSGNDWDETLFRDALTIALCKDKMEIDYQGYQPAAVFINGDYWGIHNIREKINKHFPAQMYDIDPDDIDILERNGDVIDGENTEYNELMNFVNSNDMSDDANLRYVADQITLEGYMDYVITEIYIANTDWPGNNIKFWKERGAGKWRWILFDTDFGLGWHEDPSVNTIEAALADNGPDWPNPPWSTQFLRKLMENESFKNQFLQRFAYHIYSTFSPERVNNTIDSIVDVIGYEMEYHIERWGTPADMNQWYSYIDNIRNWVVARQSYMMTHLKAYFDISDSFFVSIANNESNVSISINGDIIETPYEGQFFADIPLIMAARPDEGYLFDQWNIETYSSVFSEIIPLESEWKYNDEGIALDEEWNITPDFDRNWPTGNAPMGYHTRDGVTPEATILSYGNDAGNKHTTYYFRKTFTIEEVDIYTSMDLEVGIDDGAVIYINGIEVLRQNMPDDEISYETFATAYVDDGTALSRFSIPTTSLIEGENLIAVEVHQANLTSSDVRFDMSLSASYFTTGDRLIEYTNPWDMDLSEHMSISLQTKTLTPLTISEICNNPSEEASSQFIEIFNAALYDVDLDGYSIRGDIEYLFNNGDIINANEFIVIAEDASLYSSPNTFEWTSGLLNESGTLYIVDPDGDTVDIVLYNNQSPWPVLTTEGLSIVLSPLNEDNNAGENWSVAEQPSPGSFSGQQIISGLIINEIMSDNLSVYADEYGDFNDWIEIYNTTDEPIDMAGLLLTDGVDWYTIPQLYPEQTVVQPHGYILFQADNDQNEGPLHTNFAISRSGEQIGIFQVIGADTLVLDIINAPALSENISYGRYPDIIGEWQELNVPTPGAVNNTNIDINDPDVDDDIPGSNSTSICLDSVSDIIVYPNPTKGLLIIKSDSELIYNVKNLLGVTVSKGAGKLIDLSGQANGVYLIQLDINGDIVNYRVIKE